MTASSRLIIRLRSGDGALRAGEISLLAPLSETRERAIRIPAVDRAIAAETIQRIHDFHRTLADANSDPVWWYLPVSEWQPAMSALPQAIELEARLSSLKQSGAVGSYVLTIRDDVIAFYLLARFKGQVGLSVFADRADRLGWAAKKVKRRLLRWINSAAWLFENLSTVRRSADGRSIPVELDTLLISRIESGAIAEKRWRDRYLGDLPHEAMKCTGSAALLVRAAGNPAAQVQQVRLFRSFPVFLLGSLLRARDVFSALRKALAFDLKTGWAEPVLAAAARREARNHVRAIADWLLIERSVERFLSVSKPRQIVCMQENSSWEHAVVQAARRRCPDASLIGFFHCPVMPSAFRYRTRADIRDRRPLFRQVVGLGPAHRQALLELGEWAPLMTKTAYAFRNPQLDGCLAIERIVSDRAFTVLVALGGMFDNVAFLRWLMQALQPIAGLVIEIKPHPAYDSAAILREAGVIPDGRTIRVSKDEAMDKALADVDVMICKGSTVGFSALAAGVPVIHVDDGGLASDDALFASSGLSRSVSTAESLRSAISDVRQQSPQQRQEWTSRARAYVRSYYDVSTAAREAVLADLFPVRSEPVLLRSPC